MLRLLAICTTLFVATACQSADTAKATKPSANGAVFVAYTDYRSSQRLELVNESHTSRVDQYSKVGTNANRKVQSDEIVDALVEHFDQKGFGKLAQQGHAPEQGNGRWLWSIELETAKGLSFIARPSGISVEEQAPYRDIAQAFIATYNSTYGLQAVKVNPGETPFKAPDPPKSVKQH